MTLRKGRRPDPREEAAHLSDDDVQRRLGGDAGLGDPVPERAVPPPPPPSAPTMLGGGGRGRGRGGVVWRDVGLVLALLAFLAIGARVVLPDSSTAVASLTPGPSLIAVASPTSTATPAPTPSPTGTPPVLPSAVVPSLPPEATPTPEPTATPTPTPTPRATPRATPHPTPTPAPQTATVTVNFLIRNLTGGNDGPASWTVRVTGAGASPASFPGSASGTSIRVNAGQAYSISTSAATPGGYSQSLSDDCSGALSAGQTAQCTITESDIEPRLQVFISGLPSADPTTVTISSDANATPSSSFTGSAQGTTLHVFSNVAYTITTSDVAGYAQSSRYGSCSGPLREGAAVQCILYFTSTSALGPGGVTTAATDPGAALATDSGVALVLPAPVASLLRVRRRRR